MPRPQVKKITFEIDGREVSAPEGKMLVDAARENGDVEIPYFCYQPKLGQPVGACRMCLVEVEGIPKLQTGCSTPVKDGMVVHTQTERVREAQQAVVEFLLINHPLDCPVCDKGGECPLQDISFGWGGGRLEQPAGTRVEVRRAERFAHDALEQVCLLVGCAVTGQRGRRGASLAQALRRLGQSALP